MTTSVKRSQVLNMTVDWSLFYQRRSFALFSRPVQCQLWGFFGHQAAAMSS